MISKRTVLILGAGASAPYGFPPGRALLVDASAKFGSGDQALLPLLSQLNIDPGRAGSFALLLRQSMQPSIDAFVEQRHEFLEVGKAAIAVGLIPHEKQHFIEERSPQLKWYEYLFHHLGPSPKDIEQSNLTIVTFNYDRSLEYFLYNAIHRAFGRDAEGTKALYSHIPIIHVHGRLGTPHFTDPGGRPYVSTLDLKALRTAITSIVIPGAENADPTPFQHAQAAIASAEVVCFIGFAFHAANIQRLGIPPADNRATYACAYHLPKNVIERAKAAIAGHIQFGAFEQDALSFLQDNPVLE